MGLDIVFGIINFGDVFHGTYNRRGDFPYYRNLSSVGNQGRVLVRGEDLVDIRSVGSGDARGLAVDGECHYLDVAGRMGRVVVLVDRRTVRATQKSRERVVSQTGTPKE